MKKIKGNKPIDIIAHIHMEISPVNFCSYLYLKLSKMSCFFYIFSLFSSTKSNNRRTKQVLPRGESFQQQKGGGDGKRG
jgi:hypothetical protein